MLYLTKLQIYSIILQRCSITTHFPYLVHPCDKASNGGCNQICNKRKEKFECGCEDGFVLAKDGKACNKG